MKFVGEITDPVHRYILFSEDERRIIDTRVFQRLRSIRQLAGAHLVYPSAQHSRFEHSLGVMHLAGFAGETLLAKGLIDDCEIVKQLRLAALLHDIGHGPFSHLFEEVLETRCRKSHEDMGRRIIMESEIGDILNACGYDPAEICRLSFGQSKVKFLNEVIAGGLAVDLMDYLPRDSFFTGTEYGKIDYNRLIGSFEVAGGRLGINRSSLNSLESMLISRYEMFKAVYFHKTVRSAEVMLLRSMILADDKLNLTDTSLENYLGLTDEVTLEKLCLVADGKERNGGAREKAAAKLASDYRSRKLLKCVYEKLVYKRDKMYKKMYSRQVLSDLESRIADMAGTDDNSVFVDASRTPSMPLTPTKEEMYSVLLVDKGRAQEMPISEIPLIDSISGFFDTLRVYTTAKNRDTVRRSVKKVLGSHDALYVED